MALTDRLRLWLARGALKAATWPVLPAWTRHAFMQPTFEALTQEGYRANGAVFACVSALAFGFVEPLLKVYKTMDGSSTPLPAHPLQRLLNRPNPQMGMGELLAYSIVYCAISGNCYWLKVRSAAGRVVELWPTHGGMLTPVSPDDGRTLIDHYELNDGTGVLKMVPASDVLHWRWLPDPSKPALGIAPLVAVAREVDTDNEAGSYIFALLKNDAIPRIALVAPAGAVLSPEQRTRMREEWAERYGGENRGKPAVLEGGLDVKRMGLDLTELAFESLRRVPETRICAAFRVPPIVAGVNAGLERATYANFAEAVQFFTLRTLVPLWRGLASEVEADLLPEFGAEGLSVAFDLSRVEALAENVQARRTWVDGAIKGGYMTVNEGRSELGLPRDAEGDVYLRTIAMVPTPAALLTSGAKRLRLPPMQLGLAVAPAALLEIKAKRADRDRLAMAQAVIQAQQMARRTVAGHMEAALERYFADLADSVVHRALNRQTAVYHVQRKDLPEAEELLTEADRAALGEEIKRWYIEIISQTWETWNTALGVNIDLDLNDPLVVTLLGDVGTRIRDITDTTLQEIRSLLQIGHDAGWSIDHLVRGDPANGVRGLRDVVIETYKNRAKTVARTELGYAQNQAAWWRYQSAGVKHVLIFDNGLDDDDEPCQEVNGTTQTLEWFKDHPLEHPNCTRGAGPVFD